MPMFKPYDQNRWRNKENLTESSGMEAVNWKYLYIYIYTWNPNDLYFLKVNPAKQGLFQSKQGSFGF